jgi:hypothetical protein
MNSVTVVILALVVGSCALVVVIRGRRRRVVTAKARSTYPFRDLGDIAMWRDAEVEHAYQQSKNRMLALSLALAASSQSGTDRPAWDAEISQLAGYNLDVDAEWRRRSPERAAGHHAWPDGIEEAAWTA